MKTLSIALIGFFLGDSTCVFAAERGLILKDLLPPVGEDSLTVSVPWETNLLGHSWQEDLEYIPPEFRAYPGQLATRGGIENFAWLKKNLFFLHSSDSEKFESTQRWRSQWRAGRLEPSATDLKQLHEWQATQEPKVLALLQEQVASHKPCHAPPNMDTFNLLPWVDASQHLLFSGANSGVEKKFVDRARLVLQSASHLEQCGESLLNSTVANALRLDTLYLIEILHKSEKISASVATGLAKEVGTQEVLRQNASQALIAEFWKTYVVTKVVEPKLKSWSDAVLERYPQDNPSYDLSSALAMSGGCYQSLLHALRGEATDSSACDSIEITLQNLPSNGSSRWCQFKTMISGSNPCLIDEIHEIGQKIDHPLSRLPSNIFLKNEISLVREFSKDLEEIDTAVRRLSALR